MTHQALDIDAMDDLVAAAAPTIFADRSVRSVGITGCDDNPRFLAIRTNQQIVPFAIGKEIPNSILGLPIEYKDTYGELEAYFVVPLIKAFSATIVEQQQQRPMYLGCEIQNLDFDIRSGNLARNVMNIGSISCFVDLGHGEEGIISNNHVLSGVNNGTLGDQIMQDGQSLFSVAGQCANFRTQVPLRGSPAGAHPALGNAIFNEVDCASANILAGVGFSQSAHISHGRSALTGADTPSLNDRVYKVGRTTGLRTGRIISVRNQVGPVPYNTTNMSNCWFRSSFIVEGDNGEKFADQGDSGAPIVRVSDGKILGIVYSGTGQQTYGCPIDLVLNSLKCTLLP